MFETVTVLTLKIERHTLELLNFPSSAYCVARWCSGLTYRPVTPKITGSNPVRVATPQSFLDLYKLLLTFDSLYQESSPTYLPTQPP